ncbi:thioredoxin family protein [Pontiella agarivorans]|uniref:Thioredoxin family protein n=1 Tax=Pontiella agarivorans TaxID=3038953 RepID=A0ABU5MU87_9BACT|nr:thioredoxin family protein [Pontiella agarivorans]MDZ8117779.1 thioredoxin family protein [Pontiella agarivorans]
MENEKTPEIPETQQRPGIKKRISQIFWLAFLAFSLAAAWYCFYAPSNDVAWAGSYTEAQKTALKTDKPMILFFTAAWCSPCRIMKRTVWADNEIAAEVNKHFIPVEIYADSSGAAELFTRYNITGTPVTLITHPDGTVIDYAAGKTDKTGLKELLRKQFTHSGRSL